MKKPLKPLTSLLSGSSILQGLCCPEAKQSFGPTPLCTPGILTPSCLLLSEGLLSLAPTSIPVLCHTQTTQPWNISPQAPCDASALQASGCILTTRYPMCQDLRVQRFGKVSFCSGPRGTFPNLVVMDTKRQSRSGRSSGLLDLCPVACTQLSALLSSKCSSPVGLKLMELRCNCREKIGRWQTTVLGKSRAFLKLTAGWCQKKPGENLMAWRGVISAGFLPLRSRLMMWGFS